MKEEIAAMMKKTLALILSIIMCISLLPTCAFAEEQEVQTPAETPDAEQVQMMEEPAPDMEANEEAEEIDAELKTDDGSEAPETTPAAEPEEGPTPEEEQTSQTGTETPAEDSESIVTDTGTELIGPEESSDAAVVSADGGEEEPVQSGTEEEPEKPAEKEQAEPAPTEEESADKEEKDETAELMAVVPISGSCGANARFSLNSSGTLTITGSGDMYDYTWQSTPWYDKYNYQYIKTVVIGEGITRIGNSAFEFCGRLTSVSLPSTLKTIGGEAFGSCYNLPGISLPSGLSGIETSAFKSCSGLTTITIPSGIKRIENDTFWGCSKLRSVTLPESLTVIEEDAFANCDHLPSIDLPQSLKTIGKYAFAHCSALESITIPEKVTSLPSLLFSGCTSLETIHFLGNAPTIDTSSFQEVVANAYYNPSKQGWTGNVFQNYGGTITWIPEGGSGPVEIPVSSLSLNKTQILIVAGQAEILQVSIQPSNATNRNITWSSSNTSVATVSGGRVTGVGAGVTVITATAHNGLRAQCTVGVLFSDVADSGAYFYNPVYWAFDSGITAGTSPSTFSPYNTCTRGQIVTFLWKAMGSPEPSSYSTPFTDIGPSQYFYKAVLWASENGITSGTSSTTFSPYNSCTRAQIVTFLWKAMGSPEPNDWSNPFTDVPESSYFYKPVLWAKEYGITSGTSATTFGPYNSCTRAQAMTFLYRAMGN